MWYHNEAYFTTGQFEREEHGFRKHCGPTAITNITLTIYAQRTGTYPEKGQASDRFRQVVRIGRRRAIYMNTDLFHLLGGTLDLGVPFYLRRCLKTFVRKGWRVSRIRRLSAEALKQQFSSGAMVYLIMRRHPVYGNHHLVCYGCEPSMRFRTADGWHAGPVYLTEKDLRYAKAVTIYYDKGDTLS